MGSPFLQNKLVLICSKRLFDCILPIEIPGPYEGGKPDATFSFKDEDFIKVATGKMNPQIAFIRYGLPPCYVPALFVIYRLSL